jgi:hypothetical protein
MFVSRRSFGGDGHHHDPELARFEAELPAAQPNTTVIPEFSLFPEFLLPNPMPEHVFEEMLVNVVAYPDNYKSLTPEQLEEVVSGPPKPSH